MGRRQLFSIILLTGLLLPHAASANAGTPLMWAGMLHLVFGNALIGIGEGLLIGWVFKRPKRWCIGFMIAANYLSAWVGGLGATAVAATLDWNLYNAWGLLWLFVGATFLATLALEWPLVALCFWKQERWLRRSVKASLLAQSISYVLLFGWYWGASGKSLYTRMEIVPAAEIKLPANLRVFYIADKDGRVCAENAPLGDVVSTNGGDRLLFLEVPGVTNAWKLVLRQDAYRDEDVRLLPIEPAIEGSSAAVEEDERPEKTQDTWFNFGPALRMRGVWTNAWDFQTGFWPRKGMLAVNEQ